jgi:hypothetical protein
MEIDIKASNHEPVGPSAAKYAANVVDLAGKLSSWGSANKPTQQAVGSSMTQNLTGRWTDGDLVMTVTQAGDSVMLQDGGNSYFGAAISDARQVQFLASGTDRQGNYIVWRGIGNSGAIQMTIWNRTTGGFGSFNIRPSR